RCIRAVEAALADLPASAGGVSSVFVERAAVAASGITGPDDPEGRIYERALRERAGAAVVTVDNDAVAALYAAHAGPPGAVVISGTGSIALAMDGFRRAVAGGNGYLLGDEGSAYAIGREGLRAALRDPGSKLAAAIRAQTAPELAAAVAALYASDAPAAWLAGLAPCVSRAARAGDAAGLNILERAGEDLGALVLAAVEGLGRGPDSLPLALCGGVATGESLVAQAAARFVKRHAPTAAVHVSVRPPIAGAALMAAGDWAGSTAAARTVWSDQLTTSLEILAP
ncbi:MAG TPA: BadF/BadG/BcrA/BcrD ATPase family protein, partial [Limnochordia bacterium]|nr:BadF/BadG/BcrA/BcrD ATPase family protein [Limnochordia bacterium]